MLSSLQMIPHLRHGSPEQRMSSTSCPDRVDYYVPRLSQPAKPLREDVSDIREQPLAVEPQ